MIGLTVIAFLGAAVPAYAIPGAQLWAARYNAPYNRPYGDYDQPNAVAVSPDGTEVFVTGYSNDANTNPDYETIAYNASNGTVIWKQRYSGLPPNVENIANAIAVSPDGTKVFVTGGSIGTNERDYTTIAYNARTGAVVWTKRYSGLGSNDNYAAALGVSPDGNTVFVTGNSADAFNTFSYDYATVAYNANTGAVRWAKRFTGPVNGNNNATALAVSRDGTKVIVTGYGAGSNTANDYETVAYNAASGAVLWIARYNGPVNGDDAARAVAVSPDSSKVVVTGTTAVSASTYDYATVEYDAVTGKVVWTARYNGPNSDNSASAVGISPDGGDAYVTGTSADASGHGDAATICIQPRDRRGPLDAEFQWTERLR